jgi:DNA-binding HxlR family transcriptional regulator
MSIPALLHHRWAVPTLAELGRSGGSRFVPLVHALGASREGLRRTLDSLIDAGLVMRNPGYGHPLRPEYGLTKRGRKVAPHCARLVDALRRAGLEDVGLRKWSVAVLLALGRERRFAELRTLLGATPRALTLALKELVRVGLVERRVHNGFPPSTSYRVTQSGRGLRRSGAALAAVL